MIVGSSLGMSSTSCYSPSALLLESQEAAAAGLKPSFSSKKGSSVIMVTTCSSKSHDYKIPKLEPFSRTKFDRAVKDPPLIEKSESQLTDYCTVLEGEDSYSCWQAYFELKDLEKHYSREELERLIIEAGGVKSLIGCLHGVAAIHKAKKEGAEMVAAAEKSVEDAKIHMHIPDGLPKTAEEMEEEEKARMPDSAYTRLLRLRGTHPAWYSPSPDHQSD